jgi:hypothetical protein
MKNYEELNKIKNLSGLIQEADGSGSYGGQSPLTYEDDELNEITKLSGLGEAKRKERLGR